MSPLIQAAVPLSAWVSSWTWRLDGRRAARENPQNVMGFWFEPTRQDFGAEGYLLTLRHGIAQYQQWNGTKEEFLDQATVAVQMSQNTLDALIIAAAVANAAGGSGGSQEASSDNGILDGVGEGKVTILKGTVQDLIAFFSYFDPLPKCQPLLVVPRS